MNKRVEELAEQSGLKVESWMTNPSKPFQILGGVEEFEKFAELIVKECLNIVGHYADVDEGISVAKKNFGIE